MSSDQKGLVVDRKATTYARLVAACDAYKTLDEHGWSIRERCERRAFLLGLFMPTMGGGCSGGFSASDLNATSEPTFAYNLACLKSCEELDFDFAFQVGRWAGYSGVTWWDWFTLDPITTIGALGVSTQKMMMLSTWHVNYAFHPMHVAKMGSNIDQITGGRWGINIVTGWNVREAELFGIGVPPLEERYRRGAEMVEFIKRAWTEDEPFNFDGEFFKSQNALVLPKPIQKPCPLLVNAGTSPTGIEFAAKHCDWLFGSPGNRPGLRNDVDGIVDEHASVVERARQKAREYNREIKFISSGLIITRDTEEEALDVKRLILAHADVDAAYDIARQMAGGGHSLAPQLDKQQLDISILCQGGFTFCGTPEQTADLLIRLKHVGVDGFQFVFFDYLPDIAYFGARVLPLLDASGLRAFN